MSRDSKEEQIPNDVGGAGERPMNRRDAIKAAGLAGAAALSSVVASPAQAQAKAAAQPTAVPAKNPYGGVPGGGITLPAYYRPTPYLVSNNIYYPGQEQVGPDEMRISFIGSTPIPVTKVQAGTCIMVELGNGKKFLTSAPAACATSSRWPSPVADSQRHLLHASARRSLRGPSLPLRLRSGGWGAGSRCASMGHRVGRAEGRHQDDDRRHENDDPVAHRLCNASPSAMATRSRSTSSISVTTTGFATTRMALSSATGGGRIPRTGLQPTGSTGTGFIRLDR